MKGRAQTIHDYLLGIVIVLVTVAVAISLVGNAYAPFFDPVDNEKQTMADNLGDQAIESNQTMWGERTIVMTELIEYLENHYDRLENRAGLPDWRRSNVSIQTAENEQIASGGDELTDQPTARSIRVVQSIEQEGDFGPCADGCRMIVQVW